MKIKLDENMPRAMAELLGEAGHDVATVAGEGLGGEADEVIGPAATREGCILRLPGIDHDVILRATFVARPIHVTGWDMAANEGKGAPKPTSRMVAPGAVYFFERADGKPFGGAEARSLWLAALGARTEEGFGRVVPGVWSRGGNPR